MNSQTIGVVAKALLLAAGASVCLGGRTEAGRQITVALVAGRPCVRGTVGGPAGTIPANFVLELGMTRPIALHDSTASLLGLAGGGEVVVALGDVRLGAVPCATGDFAALETLSREAAGELGNIPAVAYLGLGAFQAEVIELDLPAGVLRLKQATGAENDSAGNGGEPAGFGAAVFLDYSVAGHVVWLPLRGANADAKMRLATGQPFTLIDRALARKAGFPAEELPDLRLRRLALQAHVALRPEDLGSGDTPRTAAVLGTDLLRAFRLTIEPAREQLRLLQVLPTETPVAERAYYRLRAMQDAAGLQAWLAAHGDSRLVAEGAELLLGWRLREDPSDPARVEHALSAVAATMPSGQRAARLIELADAFAADRAQSVELVELALRLAEPHAAADRNGRAIHEIQARRGWLALQRGDLRAARRQLLSAMFGLPRDARVNLWMGVLYERMDKPLRAWSRYVQALLADDGLVAARRGLDRLHRDAAFQRRFRSADAVQLLEGRIPSFQPAARYARDNAAGQSSGHLIEFFTNVDEPDVAAAELAVQGLAAYVAEAPVHIVQYHYAGIEADPLSTRAGEARATRYGVDTTPLVVLDGGRILGDLGREPGAVFERYRVALDELDWEQDAVRIEGAARWAGAVLTVTLQTRTAEDSADGRLHALVCVPAIVVPGASGVLLHRHVVRHGMTPADGLALDRSAPFGTVSLTLTQAAVRTALAEHVALVEERHDVSFYMRPTEVSLDDCYIIVFVQQAKTNTILAVKRIDVPPFEKDGK